MTFRTTHCSAQTTHLYHSLNSGIGPRKIFESPKQKTHSCTASAAPAASSKSPIASAPAGVPGERFFANNPQGYLREADTARHVLEPLIYGDNHQCSVVLELRVTKIRRLRE
jgi:hypothetical protein